MKEILTKERTLELHRQMWTDMQKKLGDCPSADDRENFKANWCKEHFPDHTIYNNCFLCDYANHDYISIMNCKNCCPINWESLKKYACQTCECSAIYKEYEGGDFDEGNEIYSAAPISEILALPEK